MPYPQRFSQITEEDQSKALIDKTPDQSQLIRRGETEGGAHGGGFCSLGARRGVLI